MNKKLIISLVMIGVMAFGAGLGTFAWFTSDATSTENTFESGTLNLNVNNDTNGEYALDLGTINNVAPGDVFTEEEIVIKNDGSLDLAWAGKFEVTGDTELANALYIKDMKMQFLKPDGTAWEPEDQFITDGKGSGLYPAAYVAIQDNTMGDVITLKNFLEAGIMDPDNPGIQMGALKNGYSYKLTFTLGMAEAAGNAYQGKSMGLKYAVESTQVKAGALDAMMTGGAGHITWFEQQTGKQN